MAWVHQHAVDRPGWGLLRESQSVRATLGARHRPEEHSRGGGVVPTPESQSKLWKRNKAQSKLWKDLARQCWVAKDQHGVDREELKGPRGTPST